MDITGDKYLEDGISLEIPILPDMNGANPLDICLGIHKYTFNEEDKVYRIKNLQSEELSKR